MKLSRFLGSLGLACLLSSCSEDFDMMAPAKPITIVYGILDPADTAHYVRIQRGFGSDNQSAIDLAKLPDSSYFTNLTVTLQENAGGSYTTVQNSLPRVDLNAEGYPKQAGEFFSAPSYAYKFKYPLVAGRNYRLLIKNNDNGNTDTAETVIPNLQTALIAELSPTYTPNLRVELTPTYPNEPARDGSYTWNMVGYPTSLTARMMDAVLRFHFIEKDGQGRETNQDFDYTFGTLTRTSEVATTWDPKRPAEKYNAIFAAIGRNLGEAPTGTRRYIDSLDLIAYFGTPELYLFRENQRALGGLSGDQVQYRYTNIRGKDVIGLFAARARMERKGVPVTPATLQELKTNIHTVKSNIVDTTMR